MHQELTRKLAAAVERMPAFPQSVQRILALTQNADCEPRALIRIIENDPVLTLRILKVVNSTYHGLAQPCTTVSHAVVFLGFNTIKNLALSIATLGMLPHGAGTGFDAQQYLVHSLTTAGIARQLATRLPDVDPVHSFIAGLLHDFGKVVLAQFMPEEFQLALELSRDHGISLHLALRKIVGADHATVGAALVEQWHFPIELAETIRYQYGPELKDTGMIACVFAANQISKKAGLGFSGNACIEPFPPAVAARLGGNLEAVALSLGDLAPCYQEALAIAQHG